MLFKVELNDQFASSLTPVFVLNERGCIIFWNKACEDYLGYSADDVMGLPCRKHGLSQLPDLVPILSNLCPPAEVVRGQPQQVQRLLIHPDGTRLLAAIQFTPLLSDTGSIALIIGTVQSAAANNVDDPTENLPEQLALLRHQLYTQFHFDHIIATSPAMQRVFAQVDLASRSDAPVLLIGEPGTGKELLARTIHYQSPKRQLPFIELDCQLLSPDTIDEYVRLSFAVDSSTSASSEAIGTLYLREPQHLHRDLQQQLIQLLHSTPKSHTRLMAGTMCDLQEAIEQDLLLEPLAYQFSTILIEVPPLHQRQADLPLLFQQSLERCNLLGKYEVRNVDEAVWPILQNYSWPGNLHELNEVVRLAHQHCQTGTIQINDLPLFLRANTELANIPDSTTTPPIPLENLLRDTERRVIEMVLKQSQGNKTAAAERLQISRGSLIRRLKKFGIYHASRNKDDIVLLSEDESEQIDDER